jgi:hypothetical protein
MVRLSLSRRPWLFGDEKPTIALFNLIQQPDRTRIRSRWIGKNVANIGVQAVQNCESFAPISMIAAVERPPMRISAVSATFTGDQLRHVGPSKDLEETTMLPSPA